jgi:hypothetical protein
MTKLHFLHDWKVIEERNEDLPCFKGDNYYYDRNDYKIRIGYKDPDFKKRFNVQLLKCWICDKIKYKIIDREGKNHSRDVQPWVLKEALELDKING